MGTYGERDPRAEIAVHAGMESTPATNTRPTGGIAGVGYNSPIRRYDASSSTFDNPDRAGMAGGVNPYQYANNNPISYGDDGNAPLPLLVLAYIGTAGLIASVETLVERGFHSIWGECDFDWGSTWSRNLAIGLGTNWIPGAVFVRIGGKALGRIAIRSGGKDGCY